MHNRMKLLIVAIVVVALLTIGGTVGAMAMTHSGPWGNGYGTTNGQQAGHQGMMGGQYNRGGMMGGQYNHRILM